MHLLCIPPSLFLNPCQPPAPLFELFRMSSGPVSSTLPSGPASPSSFPLWPTGWLLLLVVASLFAQVSASHHRQPSITVIPLCAPGQPGSAHRCVACLPASVVVCSRNTGCSVVAAGALHPNCCAMANTCVGVGIGGWLHTWGTRRQRSC